MTNSTALDDVTVFRAVTVLYAFGFVLHNADHFRRGIDAVTPYVLGGGIVLGVLSLTAITLVIVDHPLSPAAAVVAGGLMAIGASASHLLPQWSVFSDPLPGSSADVLTWSAVVLEVVTAALFAAVGWRVMGRRAGSHSQPEQA